MDPVWKSGRPPPTPPGWVCCGTQESGWGKNSPPFLVDTLSSPRAASHYTPSISHRPHCRVIVRVMDESWTAPATTHPLMLEAAGGWVGLGSHVRQASLQNTSHERPWILSHSASRGRVGVQGGLGSERLLWEAVEKPGLSTPTKHTSQDVYTGSPPL